MKEEKAKVEKIKIVVLFNSKVHPTFEHFAEFEGKDWKEIHKKIVSYKTNKANPNQLRASFVSKFEIISKAN